MNVAISRLLIFFASKYYDRVSASEGATEGRTRRTMEVAGSVQSLEPGGDQEAGEWDRVADGHENS